MQGKSSALITTKDWEERVLGDISDGEPRRSSWEFEIGDRELFWCKKFSGELFCGQKNFGRDLYLGLYAENYEPFSVMYWEVGRFGDSLLVCLQQATRH